MIGYIRSIAGAFSGLFFPRQCLACGIDLLQPSQIICLSCLQQLPLTEFERYAGNPVEKTFWGRANIQAGSAHYYFTKDSRLQQIIHQFKYRGQKEAGLFFGRRMGMAILESGRFQSLDAITPLPLYATREKKRGYNQAYVLSQGIAEKMGIPVLKNVIRRHKATKTQTRKDRISRWKNMEGKFEISNDALLRRKHILLVDDIITTGATLDACANAMLAVEGVRISIAALAYTWV